MPILKNIEYLTPNAFSEETNVKCITASLTLYFPLFISRSLIHLLIFSLD